MICRELRSSTAKVTIGGLILLHPSGPGCLRSVAVIKLEARFGPNLVQMRDIKPIGIYPDESGCDFRRNVTYRVCGMFLASKPLP